MIVWLASYPRSGNTFLRIVLHRLYGVPTYSIYDDDDPVAQRIGPELVGYRPKPADRAWMQDSAEVFFTKTHKRHKGDLHRALYLVRDGRAAVVSQAHQQREQDVAAGDTAPKAFEAYLRAAILRPFLPDQPSSGPWGGNVLSWLDAPNVPLTVLRYEDLMIDPRGRVTHAVNALLPELTANAEATIPSFPELHHVDEAFFRRGAAHSFRDEMSDELHELFWAQPENAAAMERLGYAK